MTSKNKKGEKHERIKHSKSSIFNNSNWRHTAVGDDFTAVCISKRRLQRISKNAPNDYYVSEIKMTNAAAVNISMLEYGRIYAETARQGIYKEVSIICIVLIALFALFHC